MNNATIEKQTPNMAEDSPNIDILRMPPGKGSVYLEAFTVSSPEDQLIDMIRELPGGDQIEIRVSHLRTPQLRYIEQVFSDWLRAVEKSLGRNNTRVRKRFVELANRWHEETDYLSSPSRITDNDNYLKIIAMGVGVIPFILQDLQERGGSWYRALRILSEEDPVSPDVRGEVRKMKDAWLDWGREKVYIK